MKKSPGNDHRSTGPDQRTTAKRLCAHGRGGKKTNIRSAGGSVGGPCCGKPALTDSSAIVARCVPPFLHLSY